MVGAGQEPSTDCKSSAEVSISPKHFNWASTSSYIAAWLASTSKHHTKKIHNKIKTLKVLINVVVVVQTKVVEL